jgi:hypothetical protein
MKKALLLFCTIAFLLGVLPLFAAEDQAFLAILADTKVTKMVGMPAMPEMPKGINLSKLPGIGKKFKQQNMMSGEPQRVLEVRLWSPGIAKEDAFAYVVPPKGLKQGKKLDLNLYRPEAETGKTESGGAGEFDPNAIASFTIKIYWGSSEKVRPGQPKIIKFGSLTADQQAEMKRQASKARTSSYFYKPDWTTGYWPTKKQAGEIDKDASLVGNYALTTNYTGNIAIDAPENVDFLAPFDLSSPNFTKAIPFEEPLALDWKQIPNALGLYASVFGMEGQNTMIIWSSSEVFNGATMGNWDYMQMAEVRDLVSKTIMMKGDTTKAIVPAGIFKNADIVNLTMLGYGPGAALDQGQPLPRIQTKSSLMAMLGGKSMPNMGGEQNSEQEDK